MRFPLLALMVALSLLLPFGFAAPGGPTGQGLASGAEHEKDSDENDSDEEEKDDEDGDETKRGDKEGRSLKRAAVGSFELTASSQTVDGEFVDFTYNDTGVQGFTLSGARLFDLHVVGDPQEIDGEDERGVVARGAQLKLQTASFDLHVHDTPTGVTKLETDGVATFLFAEGVTLRLSGKDRVSFTIDGLTGVLRGEDVEVAGRSVLARDEVLLLFNQAAGGFDKHREAIGDAVVLRQVGAEASFSSLGDDDVEDDVISYGNVTLRKLKAEKGNLTVEVDGHGFDGRVIVLNIDGRVLGAKKSDDLTILFDDEVIRNASSIQDVLDADDDGLKAEYYVVFDPATESFQLLVSVPHYSIHTISVTTVLGAAAPSIVAGILVGVLVLAASGVVLFRRPRA